MAARNSGEQATLHFSSPRTGAHPVSPTPGVDGVFRYPQGRSSCSTLLDRRLTVILASLIVCARVCVCRRRKISRLLINLPLYSPPLCFPILINSPACFYFTSFFILFCVFSFIFFINCLGAVNEPSGANIFIPTFHLLLLLPLDHAPGAFERSKGSRKSLRWLHVNAPVMD